MMVTKSQDKGSRNIPVLYILKDQDISSLMMADVVICYVTCRVVPGRQADGLLQETELGMVKSKSLVNNMGCWLHIHLKDGYWLTILCFERNLWEQWQIDTNISNVTLQPCCYKSSAIRQQNTGHAMISTKTTRLQPLNVIMCTHISSTFGCTIYWNVFEAGHTTRIWWQITGKLYGMHKKN